jgi:shikimate dehydrogenase
MDWVYIPFEVPPDRLRDAVRGLGSLGLKGVNVTIPYKEQVIQFLDSLSQEARLIGAVNTIKISEDGKLTGYNTDALGFGESLKRSGVSPRGKKVFLIGAGGAGRAISCNLAMEGVKRLLIHDIAQERSRSLVEHLQGHFAHLEVEFVREVEKEAILESDILINATPVGMQDTDPRIVPAEFLHRSLVVYDIIYNPPETPLLKDAKVVSKKTLNGIDMLLFQGMASFQIWTGVDPPEEVMRKALWDKARIKKPKSLTI